MIQRVSSVQQIVAHIYNSVIIIIIIIIIAVI